MHFILSSGVCDNYLVVAIETVSFCCHHLNAFILLLLFAQSAHFLVLLFSCSYLNIFIWLLLFEHLYTISAIQIKIRIGFEVLTAIVMKSYIFWDIRLCSPSNFNGRFGGTLLAVCAMLVSCLAYASALKMETTCSSVTSVNFQGTTKRYISEDRTKIRTIHSIMIRGGHNCL
jgi:hypothetical protein